ncbi:hypothetical protein ACFL6Y_08145 [Elusimicrobiota bacterium]
MKLKSLAIIMAGLLTFGFYAYAEEIIDSGLEEGYWDPFCTDTTVTHGGLFGLRSPEKITDYTDLDDTRGQGCFITELEAREFADKWIKDAEKAKFKYATALTEDRPDDPLCNYVVCLHVADESDPVAPCEKMLEFETLSCMENMNDVNRNAKKIASHPSADKNEKRAALKFIKKTLSSILQEPPKEPQRNREICSDQEYEAEAIKCELGWFDEDAYGVYIDRKSAFESECATKDTKKFINDQLKQLLKEIRALKRAL